MTSPRRFYIKNKNRYQKIDPIGLVVRYDVDGNRGHGVVIGTMDYDEDVWCVATEKTNGMPLNKLWCTFSDRLRNLDFAKILRERYVTLYGEKFNGI